MFRWMRFALFAAATLACACGTQTDPGEGALAGACVTDFSCPDGEECGPGGCQPVASTIYPHIQLASALLDSYADPADVAWRAAHYDLLIGALHGHVDAFRGINPDVRLFEYVLVRRHPDEPGRNPGAQWAAAHGYDPEDFYIHYREDVDRPDLSGTTIVPGYPIGFVPGWNPDPAPGDPPASATTRAQSRVPFTPGRLGMTFMPAVGNAGYRAFYTDFVADILDGSFYGAPHASGPVEGIMCDVAVYYPEFDEGLVGRTGEYAGIPMDDNHPYSRAFETLYPELALRLGEDLGRTIDVMPNYGHVYFLEYDSPSSQNLQRTTPWGWGEVWLTYNSGSIPTRGNYRVITWERDYNDAITSIVRRTRSGARRLLGARDQPLNGAGGSDRGRILLLALYYMVHNHNTWFLYESMNNHGVGQTLPLSGWAWNAAVEFDIGRPVSIPEGSTDFDGRSGTNEHYVMAQGTDPVNAALTFRVLARRFENGLVLAKMLPDGSATDDRSITTHTLDGSYFVLQADGSLGPVITEATLRNNEGLILIPAD